MTSQAKATETSADARVETISYEAKRDDEHGLERPWIASVNGVLLRNKLGAIRTFSTEAAALKAAKSSSDRSE